MDWFQNKTTQIIALVSIIGTFIGFGVTGGSYINRLENLEAKIGGINEAEDNVQVIEERFESIETSVQFFEKAVDSIDVPDVTEIKTVIASETNPTRSQVSGTGGFPYVKDAVGPDGIGKAGTLKGLLQSPG